MKSSQQRQARPIIWLAAGAIGLALALAWLVGGQSQAQANTFTVNTPLDAQDVQPGDGYCATASGRNVCTLRAAVQETNALPGADLIVLPAGIYTLTLAGAMEDQARFGDLDIRDDLTLTGAGAGVTIVDGNALDRVIDLSFFSTEVVVAGVTLRNGNVAFPSRSSDDVPWLAENGGCVLSLAELTMRDSVVTGCRAGRMGGGIYAEGELALDNTTVAYNQAGEAGGGIYSDGELALNNTTVSGNQAGEAGGGVFISWAPSVVLPPTPGGPTPAPAPTAVPIETPLTPAPIETPPTPAPTASTPSPIETPPTAVTEPTPTWTPFLFETPTPRATPAVPTPTVGPESVTVDNSVIASNSALRGGGIFSQGWLTLSGSQVISNTASGSGGGVFTMNWLRLERSTVRANFAGEFGGGIANDRSIDYHGGMVILEGSTVSGNTSQDRGGGIANSVREDANNLQRELVLLINSTISRNAAGGSGGGIYTGAGVLTTAFLDNGTISANIADADGDGQGDGGGIFNRLGAVQLRNTVLAGNQDLSPAMQRPDCWTPRRFQSGGYNLIGNASTCLLDGILTGNLTGVDAQLGPLHDNGGATQTHALLDGSPAIDGGNPDGCIGEFSGYLAVDQRGYMRTVDGDGDGQGVCDMGAYEFGAMQPMHRYLPLVLAQ